MWKMQTCSNLKFCKFQGWTFGHQNGSGTLIQVDNKDGKDGKIDAFD